MPTGIERLRVFALVVGSVMLSFAGPAFAHEGMGSGFLSGFMHPILGWDHVAAMVAVGLWGAFLGAPAIWLLPIAFPLVMAFGALLGVAGVPLPAVETGIAVSAVVLGILVALGARLPLWVAAIVVGAFAIFHGHAHGTELPVGGAIAYAVGFVIGTGLLHLVGITCGLATKWETGKVAVRASGAAIVMAGLAFLTGFA